MAIECYVKLVIVWFPLPIDNETSGGICVAAYKVEFCQCIK